MKTIPSLVATSTVGIAVAGLALGRPDLSTSERPSSKKRKVRELADVGSQERGSSSPNSRPGTSSTMITSDTRPSDKAVESSAPQLMTPQTRLSNTKADILPSGGSQRHSVVRNGETLSPQDRIGEEIRRESVSSRGSWIRRLSTIPNSQTNSPRSSVGPDSPSLAFSNGSAVPILSNPTSSPPQLPPNKLVKRTSSTRAMGGSVSKFSSKSELPALRRPATSHQRSVTLQQQFGGQSTDPDEIHPLPFTTTEISTPYNHYHSSEVKHIWRPFFESRPTRLTKERPSRRSSDGGIENSYSTSRKVFLNGSFKATLMKPGEISMSTIRSTFYDEDTLLFEDGLEDDTDPVQSSPITSIEKPEEQKRARRSLSMHFSSPGAWMPRSGSVRGNQKSPDARTAKRYSSAPVSAMPARKAASAHEPTHNNHRAITDPAVFHLDTETTSTVDNSESSFRSRSRNSSSPLPPLSRLSSFNLDLARLGLSSSSSSSQGRSPHSPVVHNHTMSNSVASRSGLVSPASPSYISTGTSKLYRTSERVDGASTLIDSDSEGRAFTFGDEDDMDFQSETVFDSLRSGATGSTRSHGTPLDSMFDESPPSLNGSKIKRLSIHELLASATLEGNSRIMEEDEGMSTPVKGPGSSQDLNLATPVRSHKTEADVKVSSSPRSFPFETHDFDQLSLDEDDDEEDWTIDDENLDHSNQLSPPSSSLKYRQVNPSFRAALADLTQGGYVNGNSAASQERLKSNLFDWSEPSSAEKLDYLGNSPRPKTAHAKNIADGRGGRAIGRRGPSALHIRSQSVPVVPDVAGQRENSKLAPKFGTWGLGGKGVSEEWDGDFEFESNSDDEVNAGGTKMEHSGMLVPMAIQASQENVVGHVGQIREVCLLVEDLKRLRLLAREKGLLDGPSARLWKEAEGIIALAVPDEEDLTLSPPQSPSSIVLQFESSEDKYLDQGPDATDISRPEVPFEVFDGHGRPTGYVYDGNTVRKRDGFSADNDIFGAGEIVNNRDHLRSPMNNSPRHSTSKASAEYARTVMETMHQHRSTSDPLLHEMTAQAADKMPFDTTSLRDLVNRASHLTRTLSDLIRKADGTPSPEAHNHPDSSPAFTRVFTDPTASPPKNLPRSQSNNSVVGGSMDASPTRSLGQRMHLMTVV